MRLVVVIDTLKAVEYVSIDSPKVNPSAASRLPLSEDRDGTEPSQHSPLSNTFDHKQNLSDSKFITTHVY